MLRQWFDNGSTNAHQPELTNRSSATVLKAYRNNKKLIAVYLPRELSFCHKIKQVYQYRLTVPGLFV